MKTMTCRQMGGPCDDKISANSPDEMMKKGMEHAEKNHPDLAKKMKEMSPEERKDWNHSFMKAWGMTPND